MFAQLLKLLILSTQHYISLHFGKRRLYQNPLIFCSATVFKSNIQSPLFIDCFKYETAPLKKKKNKTQGGKKRSTWVTSSGEQKKNHPKPNHKPKINFREHVIMNLSTFKLRTGYHEVITGNYTNKLINKP